VEGEEIPNKGRSSSGKNMLTGCSDSMAGEIPPLPFVKWTLYGMEEVGVKGNDEYKAVWTWRWIQAEEGGEEDEVEEELDKRLRDSISEVPRARKPRSPSPGS